MTAPASSGDGVTFAEVHTPCGVGDALPPVCSFPGHVDQSAVDRYRGRCRVVKLFQNGHLLFGSIRPSGVPNWLQVGPAQPEQPSAVSRVVGHIWVTAPADGSRVLVENLSSNNTLELKSPRLPQPITLHPVVRADDDDSRAELLGTPMVAIQAESTTLTISNKGLDFPIWIEALARPIRAGSTPPGTTNPRAADNEEQQAELDDAALRIQLAAPEYYELLEAFTQRGQVRARFENSETLQAFLTAKGIRRLVGRNVESWQAFVEKELANVREGRPTHEIHRLILEGIGTPPTHEPKWYTKLVADQLEPDRQVNTTRGGAGGGLNNLIPKVKGVWAFRRFQLEEYLDRERGADRSRGRDLT